MAEPEPDKRRRWLARLLAAIVFCCSGPAWAEDAAIIVRAGLLFDGADVQTNVDVEMRGGEIVAVRPASGRADIDLGDRLLAPGLIDTHVHLGWYITSQGRLHRRGDGEGSHVSVLNAAGNAWRMLQAGFTTVQSVGDAEDKFIRDAIEEGVIPGPRVLTSLGQIHLRDVSSYGVQAEYAAADKVRERVRALHANGADLIKIFAIDGPDRTGISNQLQLEAACAEAKSVGLRTMVHANSSESVEPAVLAGCSHVTHGAYANEEAIALVAAAGAYFEPQCDLVIRNYLDNWNWFGWDEGRREGLERLHEGFRTIGPIWMKIAALKVPYGSDAVAGAHGQNAADLVCRVRELGQPAIEALRSATAVSAQSLGLGEEIGRIAPGYRADLVAFDGDPRTDPDAFLHAVFVMRGGVVYRAPPDHAGPVRIYPRR